MFMLFYSFLFLSTLLSSCVLRSLFFFFSFFTLVYQIYCKSLFLHWYRTDSLLYTNIKCKSLLFANYTGVSSSDPQFLPLYIQSPSPLSPLYMKIQIFICTLVYENTNIYFYLAQYGKYKSLFVTPTPILISTLAYENPNIYFHLSI